MNDNVTTVTRSSASHQNGVTGKGQTQQFAGQEAQATLLSSVDKGGMRGVGLLAVVIAEIDLRNDTIDLARDYYNTNKKDYDFFTSVHEGPIQQTVTEVMSPTENPKYALDEYASVAQGMAKTAVLDKQWFETRRRTHRYAVGLQRKVDYDFAVQRAHAIVGGWNLGRRTEIAYADSHNDRRMKRMFTTANIGIGVGNIVRAGMASSLQQLASAKDNLGDTIATIGNGAAQAIGYREGRERTQEVYSARTNDTPAGGR